MLLYFFTIYLFQNVSKRWTFIEYIFTISRYDDILGKIAIRRPIIICIYDRTVECIARL